MAEPTDDRAGLPTVPGAGTALTTPLDELQRHEFDARDTISLNTAKALRSDSGLFTTWCIAAGVSSLPPVDARDLARFVDEMAEIRKPATVQRYVTSIAYMHRAAKEPNPALEKVVRQALKRMRRTKDVTQRQAEGATRKLVIEMLNASGRSLRDVRNQALLSLAYDTLARRSELTALRVQDVEISAEGHGTVTIRRSKTDQEGRGKARYLAPDSGRRITEWKKKAGITEGPMFRSVDRWNKVGGPLDPGDVARLFKGMAAAAGLSPEIVAAISGHSTRVGAAQDMAATPNIQLPAIMQAGGWKSSAMVARYTEKQEVRRGGSAQLAAAQGRS